VPFLVTNEYRGVVEGDGRGFEIEIDEAAVGQEMLTALDIARQLMRGELSRSGVGQYSADGIRRSVLEAYEIHLEDASADWYSMREFAVALMWDQQYERGLKVLAESYASDEALVRIKLDQGLMGTDTVGVAEFKKLTVQLVRYAKVNNSAMAWYAVTMILQSKGDLVHAQSNLERAMAAGLDKAMGASMGKALAEGV